MHRVYAQAFRNGPIARIMRQKLTVGVRNNVRPLRMGLRNRVVSFSTSFMPDCIRKSTKSFDKTLENKDFSDCRAMRTTNATRLRQSAESREKMYRVRKEMRR